MHEGAADAYDFGRDRLREAAYTALSPARRRLLYRRIAQALETGHASQLAGVSRQIAAHYRRSGLPAQASPYYVQLARGMIQYCAAQVEARPETVARLAQGVERSRLFPLRAMHWYFDGVATLRRQRYVIPAGSLDDAEEMLAIARERGDPGLIIQTEWGWGGALMLSEDFEADLRWRSAPGT